MSNSYVGWNLQHSYTQLPELMFAKQNPSSVEMPELVIANQDLAENLGLNLQWLESEEATQMFSGNRIPDGATPIAQAYAGHQFGHFTMLGDGRAILLGEQITPKGERVDIQLKGAGRTKYSRGGDGRAALGPMLREYIMSEAMHALGIETTRSLAVVTTGQPVYREAPQKGAILVRTASSHIRVGTIQFATAWGSLTELKQLVEYTLMRHFPEMKDEENRALSLLRSVIKRQAELLTKWQLCGFVHGVMNTDNMTLSGETIDYGPCAFMDRYDPKTVFSSIDIQGRYAYENQPKMAAWNLAQLAEALLPLIHPEQEKAIHLAKDAISEYWSIYHSKWLQGMRRKLGLQSALSEDEVLIKDLLSLMHTYQADYTNAFLGLTYDTLQDMDLFRQSAFLKWQDKWKERLLQEPSSDQNRVIRMQKANPAVIPRNHKVEEALDAAVNDGNYAVMERLLKALSDPYGHCYELTPFHKPPTPSFYPYRTYCGT